MRLYRIRTEQALPISIEEAWAFLSSSKAVSLISPESMGFSKIAVDGDSIFPGQLIQYNVKLFPFVKTRWVTEVKYVTENTYFANEQRLGPYVFWYHKHFFRVASFGVIVEDIIDYKMPFGVLGEFFHLMFLEMRLQYIFKYRQQELVEIFGRVKGFENTVKMGSI